MTAVCCARITMVAEAVSMQGESCLSQVQHNQVVLLQKAIQTIPNPNADCVTRSTANKLGSALYHQVSPTLLFKVLCLAWVESFVSYESQFGTIAEQGFDAKAQGHKFTFWCIMTVTKDFWTLQLQHVDLFMPLRSEFQWSRQLETSALPDISLQTWNSVYFMNLHSITWPVIDMVELKTTPKSRAAYANSIIEPETI